MYNDDIEYLKFIRDNDVVFSTENILSTEKLNIDPINPNIDWREVDIAYATNHVVVIDDFLQPEYTLRLRDFMLFFSKKEDYYKDYAAVNFYRNTKDRVWFPLLSDIVDEARKKMYCLRSLSFQRAWAFIYDTMSNGVDIHADDAAINLNFWVTPDESIEHAEHKNGLDIWKIYPPKDWDYQSYNRNARTSALYIAEQGGEKVSIPYKFNRMIMFDSMYFHKTQPVRSKPGYENRRINYTFLYK